MSSELAIVRIFFCRVTKIYYILVDNKIKIKITLMKHLYRAIFLSFSVLLCSCSTMINTSTQEISIKSTPANAKLFIDGKKFGTTPQVVNIERGSIHVVKLEMQGYEPYETQITKRMSSWVWANVFNGFLPGFAVDYLSGSLYYLLPESLDIPLTPLPVIEKPVKK